MNRIGGWLLLALSAFMLIGYFGAEVSGFAAVFALLVAVVLPAAGGIALLRRPGGSRRLAARREELRRDTLQSEMLRLARSHDGRLTVVEAVSELGVSPDEAKEALDGLALRDLADFEVTDSGTVVYVFREIQRLDEKHQSRGLLE